MIKQLSFMIALLVAVPIHTHAGLDKLLGLSLEEMQHVVISGSTGTALDQKVVPSAVTVFTHAQMERLGVTTLDELMALVPGYQTYRFSESSGAYLFSSRGRRSNAFGSDVLVLIDGQRMVDPNTNGIAEIIPKLAIKHFERVEFIRGPGSALYGSNAMLGVINIITRSSVNEAGFAIGEFNDREAHFISSTSFDNVQIDFSGNFKADDGDDYRVTDTLDNSRQIDTDDPFQRANFHLKLNWQDTQLMVQHYQYKAENLYEGDLLFNGVNSRSSGFTAIAIKQAFQWQEVESYLWLGYHETDVHIRGQIGTIGALNLIKADFNRVREYRLQLHNDWSINSKSRIQFGVELRRMETPADNFVTEKFTLPFQAEVNVNASALYTQYQHQLFDATHLTLGLRFDAFSGIDSNLSPRLALVHSIDSHHSLKFLYGEAFRIPNGVEIGQTNTDAVLGNTTLKAETVKTWDLIWLAQWPHSSISLGYFENRFDDAIVEVPIGGGVHQFQNIDSDPVKGVEIELSHELDQHWLLSGTYTHFTSLPTESFKEADQLASLSVNYQRSQWNVNLTAVYNGERGQATSVPGVNDTHSAYWLLHGKVLYAVDKHWQGFLQVKNLTDKNYLTPFRNPTLGNGTPNRGRQITVGLDYKF